MLEPPIYRQSKLLCHLPARQEIGPQGMVKLHPRLAVSGGGWSRTSQQPGLEGRGGEDRGGEGCGQPLTTAGMAVSCIRLLLEQRDQYRVAQVLDNG